MANLRKLPDMVEVCIAILLGRFYTSMYLLKYASIDESSACNISYLNAAMAASNYI